MTEPHLPITDYGSIQNTKDWCGVPIVIDTVGVAVRGITEGFTGYTPPQLSLSGFCPPPGESRTRETTKAYYDNRSTLALLQASGHLFSTHWTLGERDYGSLGKFVEIKDQKIASRAILFHLGGVAATATHLLGDAGAADDLSAYRGSDFAINAKIIAFSIIANSSASATVAKDIHKSGLLRRAKKEYNNYIELATDQFIATYEAKHGELPEGVTRDKIKGYITTLLSGDSDANARQASIRALALYYGLDYTNPDDVDAIMALVTAAGIESASQLQSANQLIALMKFVSTLEINFATKTMIRSAYARQIAALNLTDGDFGLANVGLALAPPLINLGANWFSLRNEDTTFGEMALITSIDLGANLYAGLSAGLFYDNPYAGSVMTRAGFTLSRAVTLPIEQGLLSRVSPEGYLPEKPIFGLPTNIARLGVIGATGFANLRDMSAASRLAYENDQAWPWQLRKTNKYSVPRYVVLSSIAAEAGATAVISSDGNNAQMMAPYYIWNSGAEADGIAQDEMITPPNIWAGEDWASFGVDTGFKLAGMPLGVGLEAWENHLERKDHKGFFYHLISNDDNSLGFTALGLPDPIDTALAQYVFEPSTLRVLPTGNGTIDVSFNYEIPLGGPRFQDLKKQTLTTGPGWIETGPWWGRKLPVFVPNAPQG